MNYVLDASAILAYLQGEPGGSDVGALLTTPGNACFAHVFNLCEVYYNYVRTEGVEDARSMIEDLKNDGVLFRRDLSVSFWQAVGDLKALGGVSLPDCVCVILASQLGAKAVTADRGEFTRIVPLAICPIFFIR